MRSGHKVRPTLYLACRLGARTLSNHRCLWRDVATYEEEGGVGFFSFVGGLERAASDSTGAHLPARETRHGKRIPWVVEFLASAQALHEDMEDGHSLTCSEAFHRKRPTFSVSCS